MDSPWAVSGSRPGWRVGDLIFSCTRTSRLSRSRAGQQAVDSLHGAAASVKECGKAVSEKKPLPPWWLSLWALGTIVNYTRAILGHRWGLEGARSQLSAWVPASQVPGCRALPSSCPPHPGDEDFALRSYSRPECAVILVCVSILRSWGTRKTLRSLYYILSIKSAPSGPREGRELRSTQPDR